MHRTIGLFGTDIVFIHYGPEADAATFFAAYGMENVSRVSDPERRLYVAFGLSWGSFAKAF